MPERKVDPLGWEQKKSKKCAWKKSTAVLSTKEKSKNQARKKSRSTVLGTKEEHHLNPMFYILCQNCLVQFGGREGWSKKLTDDAISLLFSQSKVIDAAIPFLLVTNWLITGKKDSKSKLQTPEKYRCCSFRYENISQNSLGQSFQCLTSVLKFVKSYWVDFSCWIDILDITFATLNSVCLFIFYNLQSTIGCFFLCLFNAKQNIPVMIHCTVPCFSKVFP